jgi:ribosomal protein S18 acetylase RimI-like enzyme
MFSSLNLLLVAVVVSSPTCYAFTQISPSARIISTSCGLDSKNISTMDQSSISTQNLIIERVNTKKRSLDVQIFRGFTISPAEYISEKSITNEHLTTLTESDAIDLLMPGYDDHGNYINHFSPHKRAVQFAAIYQHDVGSEEDALLSRRFDRQNGVMGVVSAQIRFQDSALMFSPETIASITGLDAVLPQHVYLANLRVDDQMRRKGIGSALLNAVVEYAEAESGPQMVLLTVENYNSAAIEVYKRGGFQYLDINEEFGTMYRLV